MQLVQQATMCSDRIFLDFYKSSSHDIYSFIHISVTVNFCLSNLTGSFFHLFYAFVITWPWVHAFWSLYSWMFREINFQSTIKLKISSNCCWISLEWMHMLWTIAQCTWIGFVKFLWGGCTRYVDHTETCCLWYMSLAPWMSSLHLWSCFLIWEMARCIVLWRENCPYFFLFFVCIERSLLRSYVCSLNVMICLWRSGMHMKCT